jgi:hypothetical protein
MEAVLAFDLRKLYRGFRGVKKNTEKIKEICF